MPVVFHTQPQLHNTQPPDKTKIRRPGGVRKCAVPGAFPAHCLLEVRMASQYKMSLPAASTRTATATKMTGNGLKAVFGSPPCDFSSARSLF